MHDHVRPSRAFTLAELIVAIVVTAILGGAVTTTLSHLAKARSRTEARYQAFSRADAAADRIALDAMAVVRDHELLFCRVRVTDQEAQGQQRDELLLLTRSLRRVRPLADGPESAEQEAHYRISMHEGQAALWRRVDHALDRAQDAGGIARPIALGVTSLSIQAYDGESWFDLWDTDYDGMPHALRVTVVAQSDADQGERPVTATARRVIAMDRVPIPPETLSEGDIESPGDESGDAGDDQGGQNQGAQDQGGQNQGGQAPGGAAPGGAR